MSAAESLGRVMDDSLLGIAKRKSKSHVVILDADFRIAYSEQSAIALLSRLLNIPQEFLDRLPSSIEDSIRRSLVAQRAGAPSNVIMPTPTLALRVTELSGRGGSLVSLLIEEHLQRRYLSAAVREYALTPRETDVLNLIIRGKSGGEIADDLCIAETTVSDHARSLLKKTSSKNRSEMLAKLFQWHQGPS